MGFSEVSNILWRERRLLDLLAFKLEEERLVVTAGRSRWLSHATREIESVLSALAEIELERAVEVQALARDLGLKTEPGLRRLVSHAPEPWDALLADHRRGLLEAVREVDRAARANRDALGRGHRSACAALEAAGEIEALAGGVHNGELDGAPAIDLLGEAD